MGNCQHFVRDFVAPLDIRIAKRLSSSFDAKVVKSLIPAAVLAEGIDAEAKCNNIHSRLWPILSDYKRKTQIKKEKEKKINEHEQFKNNFDFIANQLGITWSSSDVENEDENKQIDNNDDNE